jgi:hypothetical protein
MEARGWSPPTPCSPTIFNHERRRGKRKGGRKKKERRKKE